MAMMDVDDISPVQLAWYEGWPSVCIYLKNRVNYSSGVDNITTPL